MGNQFRDTNIIDLDTLNVQQLPAIQLPIQQLPIQLPLSDANINMIDSHMFSNLSIHDEDMPNEKESGVSANSNNALPEFPTFSGIFFQYRLGRCARSHHFVSERVKM